MSSSPSNTRSGLHKRSSISCSASIARSRRSRPMTNPSRSRSTRSSRRLLDERCPRRGPTVFVTLERLMYVNVAVLKETQPHERRVALVPSVVPKLIERGAKLHMQAGAGEAIQLPDAAFKDVVFAADCKVLVSQADVVLA